MTTGFCRVSPKGTKSCLRVQRNLPHKGEFRAGFYNFVKCGQSSEKGLKEIYAKANRRRYNIFGNCQGLSVPEEKRLNIVREEIENLC